MNPFPEKSSISPVFSFTNPPDNFTSWGWGTGGDLSLALVCSHIVSVNQRDMVYPGRCRFYRLLSLCTEPCLVTVRPLSVALMTLVGSHYPVGCFSDITT